MEDAMGTLEDVDDLEEDVQKEVDKILSELTMEVSTKLPRAPEGSLSVLPDPQDEIEEEGHEVEGELEEMESR